MPQQIYDPFTCALPGDVNSERMVLGSVVIDGSRMASLRDLLVPEDFSFTSHSQIWRGLMEMHDAGKSIDRVTVTLHLKDTGYLESIGGMSYLVDLDRDMPFFPHLESWVDAIKKKSVKRQAIIKCNELMLRLSGTDDDASELFMEASARMAEFNGELAGDTGFSTPEDIVRECGGIDKYLDYRRADGIPTPWSSLNRLTGGMRKEELIVLAAHTARGKTAFALNIATSAAARQFPVAIFSLEMSKELINDRLIAIEGNLDGRALRRPERSQEHETRRVAQVGAAIRSVIGLPIHICDHNTSTVPAMEGKLRRLMAKVPIELVIVDYIQLASGIGRPGNRAEEVGSISRSLKRMASNLKIPVIALSQFNRDSARDNREPEKYDLKESGSIEQDANLILAIHFTRMYDVSAGMPHGEVKLKVLKQRNGPEGWLPFLFHAPSGVFSEVSESERGDFQ